MVSRQELIEALQGIENRGRDVERKDRQLRRGLVEAGMLEPEEEVPGGIELKKISSGKQNEAKELMKSDRLGAQKSSLPIEVFKSKPSKNSSGGKPPRGA